MTNFAKSLAVTALIATTALSGAALAQSGDVTGRVTDVFDTQFMLEADGQRWLVTPGDGVTLPQANTTVAVTGTRDGNTLDATGIRQVSGETRAPSASDANLPAELRGLGLTDLRDREDDDGERRIGGRLPDGTELKVDYDRSGAVDEVETNRDGSIPQALLTAILPTALTDAPEFTGMTRVTEIEIDNDELHVEGFGENGARIDIEAAPDGSILSYEREVDRDRRAMEAGAARTELASLGYSDIRDGRADEAALTFTATNPYGELVNVRLDDAGRVTRERAL